MTTRRKSTGKASTRNARDDARDRDEVLEGARRLPFEERFTKPVPGMDEHDRGRIATRLRALGAALKALGDDVEEHVNQVPLAKLDEMTEEVSALVYPKHWGRDRRARMAILETLEDEVGDVASLAYLGLRGAKQLYAKLDGKDLAVAREIWRKNGDPRRTTRLPRKWEHLASMFARAGSPVKPESLRAEWNDWLSRRKS